MDTRSVGNRWSGGLMQIGALLGLAFSLVLALSSGAWAMGKPRAGEPAACAQVAGKARAQLCTSASAPKCQDALLSELAGFAQGAGVTGARGGEVYEVTTLEDNPESPAPGSFRYGVKLPKSNWIVFRVSGTLTLKSKLKIPSNKTIDGRGANVLITGYGLSVDNATNIIISDVTIRNTPNGDNIAIGGTGTRGVWVNHVQLGQAGDENFSVKEGATDVTLSWSVLADQREKTMLLAAGSGDRRGRVTIVHNHWVGGGSRLPKIGGYQVHLLNNFYNKPDGKHDVTCYSGCELLAEGNVYDPSKSGQVVMLDDGAEGHGEGYVKARGNLLLRGSRIQESRPAEVFDPRAHYSYRADAASEQLACAVAKQAGPRN